MRPLIPPALKASLARSPSSRPTSYAATFDTNVLGTLLSIEARVACDAGARQRQHHQYLIDLRSPRRSRLRRSIRQASTPSRASRSRRRSKRPGRASGSTRSHRARPTPQCSTVSPAALSARPALWLVFRSNVSASLTRSPTRSSSSLRAGRRSRLDRFFPSMAASRRPNRRPPTPDQRHNTCQVKKEVKWLTW